MNCSNIIELEILEDETNMDLNIEFQGDIIRLGSGGEFIETDPTVPDWAKQPEKPKYTAEEIGTLTAEQIESAINQIKLTPGPKGDTGEQGPRGEQGLAGDNGQDGLTPTINEEGNWQIGDIDTGIKAVGSDGKSAYEIAKENGFEGAEIEWLESLKGIIDLNYNPESENAQSGKAVAEALKNVSSLEDISFYRQIDVQNYDFEHNRLYLLSFGASLPYELNIQDRFCLGYYDVEYLDSQTIKRKLLKFIGVETLIYYEFDYTNWVCTKITSLKPDNELSLDSANPIQNKVVTEAIKAINKKLENIETGGASGSGSSETLVFEHKWENHIAHTVTAIDFENFTMTLDDATGIPTDTTGKPQSYIQLDMFGGNAILMNVVPIELINKGFKVQAIGDNKVQFLDNNNTVIQFTDTGNIDLTKFKLCVLDKPFSQVNVDNLDTNHKYHVVFDFEGYHHFTAGIVLPECIPAINNGYEIEGLRSIQQYGSHSWPFNSYSDTISFRGCGEGANGYTSSTLPAKLDVYIIPELYNGQKRALLEIEGIYCSYNSTSYKISSYCVYANGWTNNEVSKIRFSAGNDPYHGNAKARIYDCGEVELW